MKHEETRPIYEICCRHRKESHAIDDIGSGDFFDSRTEAWAALNKGRRDYEEWASSWACEYVFVRRKIARA